MVIKVLLSLIFALSHFDFEFSNPVLKPTRMTKFVVTQFDIKNGIETGKSHRIFSGCNLFCLINYKKLAQKKNITPCVNATGHQNIDIALLLNGRSGGTQTPAPSFGERLDNVPSFNSLNRLSKYEG